MHSSRCPPDLKMTSVKWKKVFKLVCFHLNQSCWLAGLLPAKVPLWCRIMALYSSLVLLLGGEYRSDMQRKAGIMCRHFLSCWRCEGPLSCQQHWAQWYDEKTGGILWCWWRSKAKHSQEALLYFLMLNTTEEKASAAMCEWLENARPRRAYYENPSEASNDLARVKTSLWSWLQGVRFFLQYEIMTMGVHEIIWLSSQKWIFAHEFRTVRSRMPKYGTLVHLS